MKKEKAKQSQIWLVMTGFSCNNNCIMCSTRPKADSFSDRPTDKIIDDLKKGRVLGYEEVDFTGGEPTIRPDILHLIEIAKELGYKKIGFNTNARMLSYEKFCRKLVENGVNRVTLTLNGHDKKLVDAIARTPGTFNQAIAGIKNISRYSHVELSANTVVSRLNYRYLKEIGQFIRNQGIRSWHLLDLIPDGNAKPLYKNLYVGAPELSGALNDLENTIQLFDSVMFFDFPLCFFSAEMRQEKRNHFITAKGRMEITKQVGYNPKRFKESEKGFYDIHKKRIGVCEQCKFSHDCAGVWEDYLSLCGEREIRYLAENHSCFNSLGL